MSHGSYPCPPSGRPRRARSSRGALALILGLVTAVGCDRSSEPFTAKADVPAAAAAIETYLREGRPDEALQVANRLRELEPASALAAELQARALLLAATHDAELGADPLPRRREALQRYQEACSLAPAEAGLWRAQGVAADMIGDGAQAIACYERAGAIDPSSMQDRLLLGLAHLRQRDFSQARTALQEAARLAPDSPWPIAGESSVLTEEGDFQGARALAQRAVAMAPREVGLVVNLAKVLRKASAPQEAAELLLALPPQERINRGATEELALSMLDLGRVADAARAWNDFALGSPHDALAASEAGRLWIRAGDLARARACADLARVAQPDGSVAADLQRLIDDAARQSH